VSPGISEDPFALMRREEPGVLVFSWTPLALIATSDNTTTTDARKHHHDQWHFSGSSWALNVSPNYHKCSRDYVAHTWVRRAEIIDTFRLRIPLVRLEGFEPPALGSEDRCSIR
jgi:hypothetical protein